MDSKYSTHEREDECIQGFGVKKWKTQAVSIPKCSEDSTERDTKVTGWDCADWIHVANGRN